MVGIFRKKVVFVHRWRQTCCFSLSLQVNGEITIQGACRMFHFSHFLSQDLSRIEYLTINCACTKDALILYNYVGFPPTASITQSKSRSLTNFNQREYWHAWKDVRFRCTELTTHAFLSQLRQSKECIPQRKNTAIKKL